MWINFTKVDTSGNTTALILDPIPRATHSLLAAKLMKPFSLAVDQVGFIEPPQLPEALARLQMMGGEYCGNGARAFAAWLAERDFCGIKRLPSDAFQKIPIETSGYDGVLHASVKLDHMGRARWAEVSMPVPEKVIQMDAPEGESGFLTVVCFPGITHVVAWNRKPSENEFHTIRQKVESKIRDIDCLGVLFYQEDENFMVPAVLVKKVGSLVWESSCGSGALAVAAALSERTGQDISALSLVQPGGTIEVSITQQGHTKGARISGEVEVVAEGRVFTQIL